MSAGNQKEIPQFQRRFFGADQTFTRIGDDALGGKAAGLDFVRREVLPRLDPSEFPQFRVDIPTLTVLTTDLFEDFLAHNGLPGTAEGLTDDRLAHAFQRAQLPPRWVGDLRALIADVHQPLAVRSSSLLEDALDHPFAGVYGTKMIPNLKADIDTRSQRLLEAIKFVYATTFFQEAVRYAYSVGKTAGDERMAVVIQEIVGQRHGDRFYPSISGVARSINYYPSGHARSEDGVVSLALGLGKQIVDGGLCWTYSPAYPEAPPPYNALGEQLKNSQTEFWAVHMGKPPLPDPIRETEYLEREHLVDAEKDGVVEHLVSTYDPGSDRLRPGLSGNGPRLLDFGPLLRLHTLPLNDLVLRLLQRGSEAAGSPVEIEFAVTLDQSSAERHRFGFLQMRPMQSAGEEVEVTEAELQGPAVLLASENVLGNGMREDIRDVVFLKPDVFEAQHTRSIAMELEQINRVLATTGRHCLLIGFGRWGSSDPWLGIPVDWGQISQARVIVEATLPEMNPDLSQGSHFFHNLISFRVLYLSVRHGSRYHVDWDWLNVQPCVTETRFAKHVQLDHPLSIRVDGHDGRGVVTYGD
jgi:hypothetical protein